MKTSRTIISLAAFVGIIFCVCINATVEKSGRVPVVSPKVVIGENLSRDEASISSPRLKRKVYSWFVDVSKVGKPKAKRPKENDDDASKEQIEEGTKTINDVPGISFSYTGSGTKVDSSCFKNGVQVQCPNSSSVKRPKKIEDDQSNNSQNVPIGIKPLTKIIEKVKDKKSKLEKESNLTEKKIIRPFILPPGSVIHHSTKIHEGTPPALNASTIDYTSVLPKDGNNEICYAGGKIVICPPTRMSIPDVDLELQPNDNGIANKLENDTKTNTTIIFDKDAEIKLDKDTEIKLEKDTEIKLDKDTEIQLDKGLAIQLQKDTEIKLDKGTAIQLQKDTEIKLDNGTAIKLHDDIVIKLDNVTIIKLDNDTTFQLDKDTADKLNKDDANSWTQENDSNNSNRTDETPGENSKGEYHPQFRSMKRYKEKSCVTDTGVKIICPSDGQNNTEYERVYAITSSSSEEDEKRPSKDHPSDGILRPSRSSGFLPSSFYKSIKSVKRKGGSGVLPSSFYKSIKSVKRKGDSSDPGFRTVLLNSREEFSYSTGNGPNTPIICYNGGVQVNCFPSKTEQGSGNNRIKIEKNRKGNYFQENPGGYVFPKPDNQDVKSSAGQRNLRSGSKNIECLDSHGNVNIGCLASKQSSSNSEENEGNSEIITGKVHHHKRKRKEKSSTSDHQKQYLHQTDLGNNENSSASKNSTHTRFDLKDKKEPKRRHKHKRRRGLKTEDIK